MPENQNDESKLLSLMKTKYGVTKSSPLKFTEKDTQYTMFRKLGENIYKNGDWKEQDYINAVDTLIRNRESFPVGTKEIPNAMVSVHQMTDLERLEVGEGHIEDMPAYAAEITINNGTGKDKKRIRYMMLDEQNKSGTKHNQHWWLDQKSEIKKTFGYANINRAIGFDKLEHDIMNHFYAHEDELRAKNVSAKDLEKHLNRLASRSYSGKKWEYLFTKSYFGEFTDEELNSFDRDENSRYWAVPPELTEDYDPNDSEYYKHFNWRDLTEFPNSENKLNLDKAPYLIPSDGLTYHIPPERIRDGRKQNAIYDFLQNYFEETYDIILQTEYEKAIDKLTRASAWQTKKNINKETLEMMQTTSLLENFKYVELDNEVDLNLFHQFESEMQRIHEVLPTTDTEATLRLRKLGNYHALGLFHPATNTIAVDFRNGGDTSKGAEYAPGGVGIQSFIHEYGHFLDFSNGSLSMQPDFKSLIRQYRENIERLPKKSPIKMKADYYGTPTEVFARAFEIYSSNAGLQTSFIKNSDVYIDAEQYKCFNQQMRVELNEYFDLHFPNYKENILKFNAISVESPQIMKQAEKIDDQVKNGKTNEQTVVAADVEADKVATRKKDKTFEEKLAYAKNRNILDVANSLGMDLVKTGRTYKWVEHDSLTIFPNTNTFKWFSKDMQGDVISLVSQIKELKFKDAVSFLNDPNLQEVDPSSLNTVKEPFDYLLKDHKSMNKAESYLNDIRGLNENTIAFFGQQGMIAEATRYFKDSPSETVVVFKYFNQEKQLVGASLQGITENNEKYPKHGRLKEIIRNSDGNFGPSVTIGEPKKLIFFESATDLMSYYQLHQDGLSDSKLISMEGLKEVVVSQYFHDTFFPGTPLEQVKEETFVQQMDKVLEKYEDPMSVFEKQGIEIVFAVDNDKSGKDFINKFADIKNIPIRSDLPPNPNNEPKVDWNQYLITQQENLESPIQDKISLRTLVDLVHEEIGDVVYEIDEETGEPTFPAAPETIIESYYDYPVDDPMTQELLDTINKNNFFDGGGADLISLKEVLDSHGYSNVASTLADIDIDSLFKAIKQDDVYTLKLSEVNVDLSDESIKKWEVPEANKLPIASEVEKILGDGIRNYTSYEELQEAFFKVKELAESKAIPNLLIEATWNDLSDEVNNPYDYWAFGTDENGRGTYYLGEDFEPGSENYVKNEQKKDRQGLDGQQAEFDKLNLFTNNIVGWKVPANLGASSALILPQQYTNSNTYIEKFHEISNEDSKFKSRLPKLYESAAQFDNLFANRDWSIVGTMGLGTLTINTVNVRPDQFGHLVGLRYKDNGSVSPQIDLYNDLLRKSIDLDRLLLLNSGGTVQKISLMSEFLKNINTNHVIYPFTEGYKENLKMDKAIMQSDEGIMEGFRMLEDGGLSWVTNISVRTNNKRLSNIPIKNSVIAMYTHNQGEDPRLLMLNSNLTDSVDIFLESWTEIERESVLLKEQERQAICLNNFLQIPITDTQTVGQLILDKDIKVDLTGITTDDPGGIATAFLKASREAGVTKLSKIDSFIENITSITGEDKEAQHSKGEKLYIKVSNALVEYKNNDGTLETATLSESLGGFNYSLLTKQDYLKAFQDVQIKDPSLKLDSEIMNAPEDSIVIFDADEKMGIPYFVSNNSEKIFENLMDLDMFIERDESVVMSVIFEDENGNKRILESDITTNDSPDYSNESIVSVVDGHNDNQVEKNTTGNSNKYWYALDLRPVSVGTHPNNDDNPVLFVDSSFINPNGRQYGAIGYQSSLLEKEIENYNLTYIGYGETAKQAKEAFDNIDISEKKMRLTTDTLKVDQIIFRKIEIDDHQINEVAKITSVDRQGVQLDWVSQIDGKGEFYKNRRSGGEFHSKSEFIDDWYLGGDVQRSIFEKAFTSGGNDFDYEDLENRFSKYQFVRDLNEKLPNIVDNLSQESNLEIVNDTPGTVLYENQVEIGENYALSLQVHSDKIVDSLAENEQSPWLIEVLKDNQSIGFLAYGQDWSTEFDIDDEIQKLSKWIQRGELANELGTQNEVDEFMLEIDKSLDNVPEKYDYTKASAEQLNDQAIKIIRRTISNPESFTNYVSLMSTLPHLSPRNVALIQEQWAGAEAVATFKQWQKIGSQLQLAPEDVHQASKTFINKKTGKEQTITTSNLSVKAGEHSQITLLRPITEDVIPVVDEHGQLTYNDKKQLKYKPFKQATKADLKLLSSGKIEKCSMQLKNSNGKLKFTTYKVFEISQTNLKEEAKNLVLPSKNFRFEKNEAHYADFTKGLSNFAKKIGFNINLAESNQIDQASHIDFSNRKIFLNPKNTNSENVEASINRLCEVTINSSSLASTRPESLRQTESEVASLIILKHFSLETTKDTKKITKGFQGISDKELSQSMTRIQKVSNELIKDIEAQTKPYKHNRNINRSLNNDKNRPSKGISR